MEKINFGYSVKNIPIPSIKDFKMQLLDKTETLIKRMRWKAFFFLNKSSNSKNNFYYNYGLKTSNHPKQITEMLAFENELIDLVKHIKFRKVQSNFQNKLKQDINIIRKSNQTYTYADKTSNLYKLSKNDYNHLLRNAITSNYKLSNSNVINKVNIEGKRLLKNHEVFDKIDINTASNCFITLKDHKDNFENNPTVRLLNPAKNEVGRITKDILSKINADLRSILQLNQWKNTRNVIDWFKAIKDKHLYKFLIFDIIDFYPSISETLLKNSIKFAEQHLTLNKENISLIFHARKSLLFNNNQVWIKQSSGLFDVSIGAFDGAEVCELVGIFLLFEISKFYNKFEVGLYRDDGLAVFRNKSGPQMEKIKKHLSEIFKYNGLRISIQCNMKIVNYLDVTLNLSECTFKPYLKPDNTLNYIHADSNHPPSILKQIPHSVELRLSTNSSTKEIFQQAVPLYNEVLLKSGFKCNLTYNLKAISTKKRNRARNIIWFNPPFSKNVSTNFINESIVSPAKNDFNISNTDKATKYSADEALTLLIDVSLTKASYQLVRNGALAKEYNLFPAYNDIRDANLKCYPSNITMEGYSTSVPSKDLLIHTCKESVQFSNLC
nr:uncharacterized protein LOC124806296 [Hydra vulgaris]